MLRRAIASSSFASPLSPPSASNLKVQIMPEDQVKAGMHGVAYTVFEGVTPEAMDVEILGVLRDMAGPKADVILARLHGKKVEYTGVVAGMSGSPVYIDGKLVGAIAYRIGEFSKEPIAGITPAASMLEIDAHGQDGGRPDDGGTAWAAKSRRQAAPPDQACPAGRVRSPATPTCSSPSRRLWSSADSARTRCGCSPRISPPPASFR